MKTEGAPRDDLARHLVPRVREIAGETEIGDFELAVCRNEQVVGLEILQRSCQNPWRCIMLPRCNNARA